MIDRFRAGALLGRLRNMPIAVGFLVALAHPVAAQSLATNNIDPVTGNGSVQFTSGEIVTFSGFANLGSGTFSVNFANGTTGSFNASLIGSQVQISGVANDVSFGCTVDSNTGAVTAGACPAEATAYFQKAPSTTDVANNTNGAAAGAQRSEARAVTVIIGDRIRGIARDVLLNRQRAAAGDQPVATAPKSGVSAGSADSRYGVWFDATGSFIENSSAQFAFDGTSVVGLGGIDYFVNDDVLVGLTVGYTRSDVDLNRITAKRSANGVVVGPYASYLLNEVFAVDVNLTYTRLFNTLTSAARGTADYNANRLTAAINLNGFWAFDPWTLAAFSGYTYSYERANDYRDATNTLYPSATQRFGAFKIGTEIGYQIGAFEPYVPLAFEYETTTPQDGTTRAALIFGAGLRYRWSDSVKAGFSVTSEALKQNSQDVSLNANIRITF